MNALTRGERVLTTSDQHHTNVIEYSKRPIFDAMHINEHPATLIQKVKDWLRILGDLAMVYYDEAME